MYRSYFFNHISSETFTVDKHPVSVGVSCCLSGARILAADLPCSLCCPVGPSFLFVEILFCSIYYFLLSVLDSWALLACILNKNNLIIASAKKHSFIFKLHFFENFISHNDWFLKRKSRPSCFQVNRCVSSIKKLLQETLVR